jgi:TATA-box binding protein (TBP) (component of TFIID and TFIIIB)
MRVTNLTAHFSLASPIDLDALCKSCLFARRTRGYNKKKRYFNSVKIRVYTADKVVTALVYSSGKVVVVGSDKETQVIEVRDQLSSMLRTLTKDTIIISNYVFTDKLVPKYPLQDLCNYLRASNHASSIDFSYEPELFPALIIRFRDYHEAKATLFSSGRINFTGIKNRETAKKVKSCFDECMLRVDRMNFE